MPSDDDQVPVNVYVSSVNLGDDMDSMLPGNRSWIVIRAFSAEQVKAAQARNPGMEGDVIYGEMNNLPKEAAVEMLKMVLDTIENGQKIETPKEATE